MMKRSASIPVALERSNWHAGPEPWLFGPAYGTDPDSPLQWQYGYSHVVDQELERKATEELLALFAKVGMGQQGDSPPRFFSGSPPARIPNPMVNDPLFVEMNHLASLSLGPPPLARVEILRTHSEVLLRQPWSVVVDRGGNAAELPYGCTQ